MDFIFNSRQKKVEIFYDDETEQKALFEFLGKHMKFKTGGIPDNVYINSPEISWTTINTQPPYTISTTNDLSGAITLNNNAISAIDTASVEKAASNSINSNFREAKISLDLDNSSDEGGYIALCPNKTK